MDVEAYETVVREQSHRVFTYATMMLRNATEAQDVAQEALVKLWQHREGVGADTARFWLKRTTHNLCVDRMRRKKVRNEIDNEGLEATSPDPGHGPQRLVEAGELGSLIANAMTRMSPKDRAVLLLREVQQMPYAEIARILEMPLGTLKARLHRARENLRDRLVRAGVSP